jgi:anti-sigma regulatory factor (Ser/Thr protein kinase)
MDSTSNAMETGFRLQLTAEIKDLPEIQHFISESLASLHADPAAEPDILLAVTEIVTNSLTHGYQDKPGWIEVLVRRNGDALEIVLRDRALKERLPGGLGIYLTRHFVDRIAYRTTPEYGNEITLVKNGILAA